MRSMDFKQIVMGRYATKKFDGRKIPQDKVDELFELILCAPSSWNIQPWKIKVINDEETKKKLAPVSWDQPQITTCSHLFVFCADSDVMSCINRLEKLMAKNMSVQKAKEMTDMMRGAFKNSTEEYCLAWAQRQTYLALENALLGAKALGFDSCPMEGFSGEEYSKILKLPKNIVPTALCAIGFAADTPQPKVRFDKKDIFF